MYICCCFFPTQWRNASQSPACWATYAVILNLARQKYRKAKSPNEENSSRLVMNVSGLETSKKLSDLAFVSKCQDFYTKAPDDILYIYFHHFQNVLNKCSKMC